VFDCVVLARISARRVPDPGCAPGLSFPLVLFLLPAEFDGAIEPLAALVCKTRGGILRGSAQELAA